MAQLVVRNLEENVKTQLRERAARHGRSMEEEVREILREAAKPENLEGSGLGSEIVAMFSGQGLGFDLPKRRSRPLRPLTFDDDNS
jgi:antitoxin FitA